MRVMMRTAAGAWKASRLPQRSRPASALLTVDDGVGRVRELHADGRERRAQGAHGEGDRVHGAPAHGAAVRGREGGGRFVCMRVCRSATSYPSNKPCSLDIIFTGSSQLLDGPASICSAWQVGGRYRTKLGRPSPSSTHSRCRCTCGSRRAQRRPQLSAR